ncbi:MFS transporter [Bacillus carboniphilus]|uniref:MFS transporter n=1 Tax=Bacillus carboniphilus TaxID=86663 RepID=A0ABP3GDY9_9BACI
MSYIQKGTTPFRMANLALFAGGFNTFAILWSTQPLLPEIAKQFNISPTVSSLSVSATTITLAISLLLFGSLSEVFGRKSVMAISLIASSILVILTALSPSFHFLLLFRILQGIALAGLPAVAMAYLGEEIEPKSLGLAMGLYISGNSIGGMGGRIISGVLTDLFNWQMALVGIGVVSLLASLLFWYTLPDSKHFKPRKFEFTKLVGSLFSQFKEPGLIYLFAISFLLMGSFVSLYNYIGFQLLAPPYLLSQTVVGFIFIVYLVGTFSSTWMGMLADQHGRGLIIKISLLILLVGGIITIHSNLWVKILGIAIFTFGFFAGHSIASGWVGKIATHDKAQASALYLFSYYFGSSFGGTTGGIFYSGFGWIGVITMISLFAILAIGCAFALVGTHKRKQKLNVTSTHHI